MKQRITVFAFLLLGASFLMASGVYEIARVTKVGNIDTGVGEGAARTVAYSRKHRSLCIANTARVALDIVSIADPARPGVADLRSVDLSEYGGSTSGVAISGELIAVSVQDEECTAPGRVIFIDFRGRILRSLEVGSAPVMLVFTPDGTKLIVANEGIPSEDYTLDPEGSVSIIDVSEGAGPASVRHVGFTEFNRRKYDLTGKGVRIFGPNATVAQDLEPACIAVSEDSLTAWVTLQENNAIAELDIAAARFTKIFPLGFKDHRGNEGGMDASDKDGRIDIRGRPVFGMYQPDGVAAFSEGDEIYLITANEGRSREYTSFNEAARVQQLALDPSAFPRPEGLKSPGSLGRLKVTTTLGDYDGDGDYDALFSFGGRSFSIWKPGERAMELIYDSGSDFERITAKSHPASFNCSAGLNARFDERSDESGTAPDSVAVGYWLGQRYAFVGLQNGLGGVMIYNITDPAHPFFVRYIVSNDGSGRRGNDISSKSVTYIHTLHAPEPYPLLAVAYGRTGNVALYRLAGKEQERRPQAAGAPSAGGGGRRSPGQ